MRPAPPSDSSPLRLLLAIVPVAALTVALPFVDHLEPRIAGVPFVLCWIVAWAIATPGFLWVLGRWERRW
jgi:hypothetical protein